MLVWVASYPRSGNSLFRLTLRDAFGIGRIGNVHRDDLALGYLADQLGTEARSYAPPPELSGLTGDQLLEAIRERPEPFFVKTHRLADADDPAPAVYLVRDGRDALVSHAHFVEARPRFRDKPFERRLAELIDPGLRAHGNWSQHVREWHARSAPTTVVRFEDLCDHPTAVVRASCEELGIELGAPSGTLPEFDALHEANPKVFRRGAVGTWRETMSPDAEERFWGLHGETMEALGYAKD